MHEAMAREALGHVDALYRLGLLDVLRERVEAGVPYLGVSAGTNVACPHHRPGDRRY